MEEVRKFARELFLVHGLRDSSFSMSELVNEFHISLLKEAIEARQGDIAGVAKHTKTERTTLYRQLDKAGLMDCVYELRGFGNRKAA